MATLPSVSVVTERGQGEHEIRVVVLPDEEPKGAMAMLGFARSFRTTRRTEDWMKELREGED